MPNDLRKLPVLQRDFDRVVVVTGAGISAESGVATFRDSGGLWEGHRIEEVATPEGFAADPQKVHKFYNARRRQLSEVEPNPAHLALAHFEQNHPSRLTLITQNVDDLHERAGSNCVLHMHGELRSVLCQSCEVKIRHLGDLTVTDICSNCSNPTLRPDIVWFGEMPYFLDEIMEALTTCDLFIAVGTSAQVYPAAGFVKAAKDAGATTVEVNLEPTAASHWFDLSVIGPASIKLPMLMSSLSS